MEDIALNKLMLTVNVRFSTREGEPKVYLVSS